MRTLFLIMSCLFSQILVAQELNIITWNIQSGGTNIDSICGQIAAANNIDIWALCEVQGSTFESLKLATTQGENEEFAYIAGNTGRADRLMIIYNKTRLDKIEHYEIKRINDEVGGAVRAPLVAHFRDKANNTEFLLCVCHLYRTHIKGRHVQALMLNEWGAETNLPTICLGDFNFDWEVDGGECDHDGGYDSLTNNKVFEWVRPDQLIRTQCTGSGINGDCKYNSVLDFIFVNKLAKNTWEAYSKILIDPKPSTNPPNSDHRMVLGTFLFNPRQSLQNKKTDSDE